MQVLCKCYASAIQVLCKCSASVMQVLYVIAMQVLFKPYASTMQALCKCYASAMLVLIYKKISKSEKKEKKAISKDKVFLKDNGQTTLKTHKIWEKNPFSD